MSDAWRVASIKSFEQVPVAPTTALLRVTAVSSFRVQPGDGRAVLAADDGRAVTRFASVPAPPDDGGLLRCAYSVPVAVVTSETVFSLEFEDGLVIALPHPTIGAARLNRRTGPPANLVPELPADGADRRSELAPKLTELSEELASIRHEAGALRDEAELGRIARAQILHLHLEAIEARAELQAVRDLTTLSGATAGSQGTDSPDAATVAALAAARQALAEHELRASEAGARADAAGVELDAERARHLDLRERFTALEAGARDAGARIVAAERDRDVALAARRAADAAVEPLRAARARVENDLLGLRDQIHKMSLERDELSRQASAFDGIAVKARERAAAAESEHRKSSGRLADLETWTQELERRLADTTTQLASARAATEYDESERRRLREEPVASRAGGPDDAARGVGQAGLAELSRSAIADAHETAERDLGDAVSAGGT